MTEKQGDYKADAQDALEMLGKGYEHPSLEIHPQQTVIRRKGWGMEEEVIPAFVKISTAFKKELSLINGDALKVWLFIALSINRNTEDAHPGVRTIAKACKVGINQVTAHVKHLEELGLLTVNREDRKYNIYKIPDYVSANTVTPQVTDSKTVTFPAETVTPKRKTVTPISDLTREPEKPYNHKKGIEEAKERIAKQRAAKGDFVDAMLSQIPATQKQIRLEGIQSRLAVAFNFNCSWSRWERFIRFADKQEQEQGQTVEKFAEWLKAKPGFDIGYWPPHKMLEVWPQAFTQSLSFDEQLKQAGYHE